MLSLEDKLLPYPNPVILAEASRTAEGGTTGFGGNPEERAVLLSSFWVPAFFDPDGKVVPAPSGGLRCPAPSFSSLLGNPEKKSIVFRFIPSSAPPDASAPFTLPTPPRQE